MMDNLIIRESHRFWEAPLEGLGLRVYAVGGMIKAHGALEKGRTMDCYAMVYLTEGEGLFESTTKGRATVHAGQGFMLFPGEWHRYGPPTDGQWHELWVIFDGVVMRTMHDEGLFSVERPLLAPTPDKLATLHQLVLDGISGDTDACIPALYATLYQAQGKQTIDNTDASMAQLLQRIDTNPGYPWDIKQLAIEQDLSYVHFRRVFKSTSGVPPHHYINRARIRMACQLLTEAGTIRHIAQRVGFPDPYHFSRVFKQFMGHSPQAYRDTIESWR